MFIFQSKFNNPPYRDRITEKSGTSKKIQWDFQISKVGSLDFLSAPARIWKGQGASGLQGHSKARSGEMGVGVGGVTPSDRGGGGFSPKKILKNRP